MKYWLWRLLGERYWKQLNSHYTTLGVKYYAEWKQKRKEVKEHISYKEQYPKTR